jgi:hypothetical protein
VLLIHGTFSASEFWGRANWFYPDPNKSSDNFCIHPSNLLADGALGAESVWRPLPDADQLPSMVKYPFSWDGTNTDQGRKDGESPVLEMPHFGLFMPADVDRRLRVLLPGELPLCPISGQEPYDLRTFVASGCS